MAFKHYVGKRITFKDGSATSIKEVYDYEPADRSVGIMTGFLGVLAEDGVEYDITDDGSVYVGGENPGKDKVGDAEPLIGDD